LNFEIVIEAVLEIFKNIYKLKIDNLFTEFLKKVYNEDFYLDRVVYIKLFKNKYEFEIFNLCLNFF